MSDFKKKFFGYDTNQVEQQLEQIKQAQKQAWEQMTEQLEKLDEENSKLQNEVRTLQEENLAVARTLIDAQKEADDIRSRARQENERITQNAKLVAEKLQQFSKIASELINSTSAEVEQLSQDLAVQSEREALGLAGAADAAYGSSYGAPSASYEGATGYGTSHHTPSQDRKPVYGSVADEYVGNASRALPGKDNINVSGLLKNEQSETVVSTQVFETENEDGSFSAEIIENSTQAENVRQMDHEDQKLSETLKNSNTSVADAVLGYIHK